MIRHTLPVQAPPAGINKGG